MVFRMLSAVVVVMLFQGPAASQPVGTDRCQCLCRTGQDEDGNGGRMAFLIYENADFSICPIFNDRSCEIMDPDTGESHYGMTDLCEPLSDRRYESLKGSGGRGGMTDDRPYLHR